MNDLLRKSANIIQLAIDTYHPKLTVMLVSGGDDSVTGYYVARALGIQIDYIVHIDTCTGIKETRQFVEQWSATTNSPLIIREATMEFERYLHRKGFFGRGEDAHKMAYHVLKAGPLRKAISSLRKRKRNFPVMMLTGIRLSESDRRKYNFATQTIRPDPGAESNIFVNFIEHWSDEDLRSFMRENNLPRNPVSKALHRSAECMCGTMQSQEDRKLASILYPPWGRWLDQLEAEIIQKWGWGWGEEMPKTAKQRLAGQLPFIMEDGFEMCRHCLLNQETEE